MQVALLLLGTGKPAASAADTVLLTVRNSAAASAEGSLA